MVPGRKLYTSAIPPVPCQANPWPVAIRASSTFALIADANPSSFSSCRRINLAKFLGYPVEFRFG